jgi:tetratricopeptide (TPR) repeat protein
MGKKIRKESPRRGEQSITKARPKTKLSQAVIIILVSVALFFGLLEGGLALFGVKPVTRTEDPFVGFAANMPLFVPAQGPDGRRILRTARNKTGKFNRQEFARKKVAGTYRIFSLGGSTTYGRPYDDRTSFTGWLRELLPHVDSSKQWEVINAGGISYASYRVAHLMEELVDYQPDLFVIYTGQNEFLEERTYRELRSIPPLVRSAASLLAYTRTWAAMTSILRRAGVDRPAETAGRDILAADVTTKLNQSVGPEKYTRDDELQEQILEHYRLSLERMVALARAVDAKVIFVTPASNLKDCSPFKSEHTDELNRGMRRRLDQMLARAKWAIGQGQWKEALALLDEAVAADPRHAELQYQRGKVLFALDRIEEAAAALRLARDQDICPLRALTPMGRIVTEVARNEGIGLVDFAGLLEQRMQSELGHPIPGEEYFLDHVHPTIDGHKVLAVALVQTMIDRGLLHPKAGWEDWAVAKAAATIEGGIDEEAQGEALANLARVLLWAGKNEDAARLARQALETAREHPQVVRNAAGTLASFYQRQGRLVRARRQLYAAIEIAPEAVELRLKLGEILGKRPFFQLAEAAANLIWVCEQMPDSDVAQQLFGQTMAWRGRPRIAYGNLKEALRLNPDNSDAQKILAQIRPLVRQRFPNSQPHEISLDVYPGGSPRKLVQLGSDARGRNVPDGIEVEFYENGRVKRLVDLDHGAKVGVEMTWDEDGRVVSRIVDRQGTPVDLERARRQLYAAIEDQPDTVGLRLKLGKALMSLPFLQMDEAAAHLLWARQQMPDNDVARQLFGQAMARRGRLRTAYANLTQAVRLNPENKAARQALTRIGPLLKKPPQAPRPARILVEAYSSRAPRKLTQVRRVTSGHSIPDGIAVEFYENGRAKRLTDYKRGVRDGLEVVWDEAGNTISVAVNLQVGSPVHEVPN